MPPGPKVPTFKPDISPDPLRESAKSSAYGEVVPKKVYKKPPKPKFKPQISRSKSSAKLQSEVPSSAYGVKAALPPRPASAPRPTFKPKMKKCKVRAAASSSGYGKKAAVSPASLRPSTAPANGVRREFVPRYSLAADRAPTEEKEPTERERGFVLDAVALNNTRSPLVAAFPSPTKVKPTAHGKKLKSETASSDYFNAAPVTVPRPETAPAEPSLRFDRATSALLAELPPGPQKTALADKARSSKYGEASPAVGEKLEVPEPEPLWKPALVAAIPASEEMPEAPVNALTAKASSHRYGREAPEVGDMYETVSEPIWMPAGPGRPIPAPEPVARYNTGDAVQSHYGNGYAPANPYRYVPRVLRAVFASPVVSWPPGPLLLPSAVLCRLPLLHGPASG